MITYASDSGASNTVYEKSWLTTGVGGDTAKRGQSIVGRVGSLCWYRREHGFCSLNLHYIYSVDKGCVGGISNPF